MRTTVEINDRFRARLLQIAAERGEKGFSGMLEEALEGRGEAIGMADYLIAGICLERGATLLTRNARRFGRVSGLVLDVP